eukprot:CAMPEP_0118812202 /NCGR_PEP_ID=MMETSP1162-20130426/2142_1 /TAXON_ID=33656 /ORGANISM="Phaeocystis Sp, Strain CCMP2710" /LENGTH=46 /DNA_ID= /DNA_START= /DNA_END= /DNA_ORIENTATION=
MPPPAAAAGAGAGACSDAFLSLKPPALIWAKRSPRPFASPAGLGAL